MAASCRKEAPALSAFLVVHIHLAAHDKGLGLAPRLRQAPLYQQHVQPLLIFQGTTSSARRTMDAVSRLNVIHRQGAMESKAVSHVLTLL